MSRQLAYGTCPRPTYWRTFGAQAMGGVVIGGSAAIGTVIGTAIGAGSGEQDREKRALVGGTIGALTGILLGIIPATFAQRAVLRSPGCPSPRLGRIFWSGAVPLAVVSGGVGALGRVNETVGALAAVGAPFATAGMQMKLLED